MKKLAIVCFIILTFSAAYMVYGCGDETTKAKEKQTEELYKLFAKKIPMDTTYQKVSYSIGYNMGQSVRRVYSDLELYLILQGLVDALHGPENAKMEPEAMKDTLREFQKSLWQRQEDERNKEGEKNKIEGPKFLAENAKKPGVKTTPSGLQYKVLKEGNGPIPKETDRVKVNYRGTLLNGEEFDSTYAHGKPLVFPVDRVIPGWTEALKMMKVGSKWQLFVPSELAYKERGKGIEIKPHATLIFELELLSIEPPETVPVKQQTPPKAETPKVEK